MNEDSLEKISVNFYATPLCNFILALRDLDKKRQFLQTELDEDERMRSGWNIAGTNTGRFSSSESAFGTGRNEQNIDKRLRELFIASPGMKLANLDLEQADARNLGATCWNLFVDQYGDAIAGKYLDASESGHLHTDVCRMGWPELPWTGDSISDREVADTLAHKAQSYRDLAKRLGYGVNYQGMVNVANSTKLPMSQVLSFQDKYFDGFPCIKMWHEWIPNQLREFGFITTLL